MVTNPPKIFAPWGSKGRTIGLTRTHRVDPLLKIVNGKPISQASQESADKPSPDGISTPSLDNERPSMILPSHLSSPSRSSDVEAPRRDPGVILSSPGLFDLDSPISGSQKSAPKSSQASTRGRKTARESTESVDSDSDDNGRAARRDMHLTNFKKPNKDDTTALLISSDSKIGAGSPRRRGGAPISGSSLSAAPKPNVDAQEAEKTPTEAIFGKIKIRTAKQRTFSRKNAGDEEPSGQKKRGGLSTGGRDPKKQRSSQEEKKNLVFSDDERTSTRRLPELLPPPENGSSPLHPTSSIPLRLDSSPPKPRAGLPKRILTLDETPGSATQIEPFRIPDLLDDPFRADVDRTTPTAATSKVEKQKNGDDGFDRPHSPIRLISSPVIPLSDPPSSPIHLPALLKPALCPLCKEEVDHDLLAEFQEANPRQTVQSMQRFCLKHKRRSAKEAWRENGYPQIHWGRQLDKRIEAQYPFIRSILQGKRESYYAAQFREKIKGGQNKTLLSSDENLTPGYYGIRGLRQMSENLIQEFSSVLRKRALEDNLISARGHTAYLQAVLVPELATRLVMEDMLVGEEEARGILVESSWVGELVNDEIADVVFESDSEDEEDGGGDGM